MTYFENWKDNDSHLFYQTNRASIEVIQLINQYFKPAGRFRCCYFSSKHRPNDLVNLINSFQVDSVESKIQVDNKCYIIRTETSLNQYLVK